MNFERGIDPKEAMDIGRDVPKKKGDRFFAGYPHGHEKSGQKVEVEATSEEQRADEWITRKQDERIERRMVDVKFVNGEETPMYLFVTSSDWFPGEWTINV